MSEIICPECGRPNLPEATKCWYCQTVIELDSDKEVKRNPVSGGESSQEGDKANESHPEPSETKNIPEWLHRVRERVQEDSPQEVEESNWEQEVLFEGESTENKPRGQKRRKKLTSRKTKIETVETSKTPSGQGIKNEDLEQEVDDKIIKKSDADTEPEDLPEGFIRLDGKEE